jgi:hypothetical protein
MTAKRVREGEHKPFNHVVRIVVLPRAGRSRSHGGKHGAENHLTPGELKAAEADLKKMAAPSSPARSARRAVGSGKRRSMFEALKPTDIVVVGREPASVRRPRQKRQLFGHNDQNKDTVLRVWTESDTIEYRCDQPFEIRKVQKAGWRIHAAPNDPFGKGKPYRARPEQRAGGRQLWVWRSGVLPATANNQQYKMTFRVGRQLIDPDVVCGSPPPS